MGNEGFTLEQKWPEYKDEWTKESEITLIVQVNGKVRAKINVPAGLPKEELEKIALSNDRVQKWIEGKNIVKVVVVPNKLVNIVVR